MVHVGISMWPSQWVVSGMRAYIEKKRNSKDDVEQWKDTVLVKTKERI